MVGFFDGLYLLKLAEWKMGSEGARGTKVSLRVAQKKVPTAAVPPMVAVLKSPRIRPMMVGWVWLNGRLGDAGTARRDSITLLSGDN